MSPRPIPRRHWRSYGNDPLPSGAEALDEPLRAFPSWFLRIVCDRCGKVRMISETHMPQSDMLIRDILERMRHDGCGGRVAKAELLNAIDGSSRPVRRIVLRGESVALAVLPRVRGGQSRLKLPNGGCCHDPCPAWPGSEDGPAILQG
jgi:hypothetical protein